MEGVKASIDRLTPAARESIRRLTQPIAESVVEYDHDLTKLPSASIYLSISVPPNIDIPSSDQPGQHSSAVLNLPTIIFLPGMVCDSTIFEPIIRTAKLREEYRVVSFDYPGCGKTPLGTFVGVTSDGIATERVERQDKIFEEVLGYVGVTEKTFVVAHSLGVRLLERYLIKNPDHRVKGMLLLSPNIAQNQTTLDESGFAATSMVFEQGFPFVHMLYMEAGFSPYSKVHRPLALALLDGMINHATTRLMLLDWLSLFADPIDRSPILQQAKDGKLKIILVTGEDDQLISPQAKEELYGSYGSSDSVNHYILQNVGHWSMLEDYEAVCTRMEELLSSYYE